MLDLHSSKLTIVPEKKQTKKNSMYAVCLKSVNTRVGTVKLWDKKISIWFEDK